jgi:hypothetical protein
LRLFAIGEVLLLSGDILWEAGCPLELRALVLLGDKKTMLQLSLAALLLLRDKARWWREVFSLLERPHVVEVHRRARAPKPPHHGIVRVRRLVCCLKGIEADALVAGPDFCVEGAVGRS